MEAIMQISEMLAPVFASHNVKKSVLFGSYSKGIAEKDSDIDIIVDSGLKGLEFVELIEDNREAIKKEVDLIDICHINVGSLLHSEIQKTGVIIYEE